MTGTASIGRNRVWRYELCLPIFHAWRIETQRCLNSREWRIWRNLVLGELNESTEAGQCGFSPCKSFSLSSLEFLMGGPPRDDYRGARLPRPTLVAHWTSSDMVSVPQPADLRRVVPDDGIGQSKS